MPSPPKDMGGSALSIGYPPILEKNIDSRVGGVGCRFWIFSIFRHVRRTGGDWTEWFLPSLFHIPRNHGEIRLRTRQQQEDEKRRRTPGYFHEVREGSSIMSTTKSFPCNTELENRLSLIIERLAFNPKKLMEGEVLYVTLGRLCGRTLLPWSVYYIKHPLYTHSGFNFKRAVISHHHEQPSCT